MRYFTDSPYEKMMMQKPKMNYKKKSTPPHKVKGEQKENTKASKIATTKKGIPEKQKDNF